jgi:hypothetical protein
LCFLLDRWSEPLADKPPGGADDPPHATELGDVLAQDLSGLAIADVVVERPTRVGDLT